MKLLIITQKVDRNDPILGFFHRWIEEFAKHVEQLTVICLEEGVHTLPSNIRVLSLGKEKGVGKLGRVWRLYTYIWQYRRDYDRVFVHMNQIYVILCWKIWWLLNKKFFLWYAHGAVPFTLRIAEKLVTGIFTSTPQGFRISSKKVHVVGQGIDTALFTPCIDKDQSILRILVVGRVSKIKNVTMVIRALQERPDAHVSIVGCPITADDVSYQVECVSLANELGVADRIAWYGAKEYTALVPLYQDASVVINMSNTGSLDKVILESIACGTPVISSNASAQQIDGVVGIPCTQEALNTVLREYVFHPLAQKSMDSIAINHGLSRLIKKIVEILS